MNELVRRIAITIGVPLIFRVGSHIPIPLTGISAQSRLLSSGAIDQVSIFSLTLARIVTLLLASFQASGVASAMQNISGLIAGGWRLSGVEPGEATADYLDRVVSLTTVAGAVYLFHRIVDSGSRGGGGVALPYKISGGSVLIVVCTILDLQKQVRDLSLTTRGGERK